MPFSLRSTAPYRGMLLLALLNLSLLLLKPYHLHAAQLLQNGGFEEGSSSWGPSIGFSTAGCPARSGNNAGVLTATANEQSAFVQQLIPGVPGDGGYTLTGYARAQSGQVVLVAGLLWQEADGRVTGGAAPSIATPAAYGSFSVPLPAHPGALAIIVRFTISGTGAICLDDLAFEGPPLSSPTPTPTPTLVPSFTPTFTLTPLSGNLSPSPTGTAASLTATRTPVPASTAPASQTSLVFHNGGFEDGLDGWEKFGGALQAVGEPRHGGSRAAAFVSSTSSTKWAYQIVRLEPALAVEFSGFVLPGPGVSRAFLRISWYTSTDGSGAAFATDDSTADVSGSTTVYQPLTTGPRVPPPTAHSARLRVMLIPVGAGEAKLYLDDFTVVMAPPPPAAPPPSVGLAPDEPAFAPPSSPSETPSPAIAGETRPTEAGAAQALPRSTLTAAPPIASPVIEVAAVRQVLPTASPTPRTPSIEEPVRHRDSTLTLAVLGAPVFLLAGGSAYVWGKRHRA